MLDAPVFGSKNEAENGELGFIVGGEAKVLEQVRPVLQSMGKISHVGSHGMGVNAKLIVNLIMAATLEAFNEGLALATKLGLKPETLVDVVNSSRARSGILDMKVPRILARDFTTFFPLRLMAKDVGLLVEAAREVGAAVPCAERVAEVYRDCVARGLGDEDFAATIKFLEMAAASGGIKTDA
jgi:3-hydroxyisobutyrate dehydrogenase-like beta-hydroxyacid dehydrogenase